MNIIKVKLDTEMFPNVIRIDVRVFIFGILVKYTRFIHQFDTGKNEPQGKG